MSIFIICLTLHSVPHYQRSTSVHLNLIANKKNSVLIKKAKHEYKPHRWGKCFVIRNYANKKHAQEIDLPLILNGAPISHRKIINIFSLARFYNNYNWNTNNVRENIRYDSAIFSPVSCVEILFNRKIIYWIQKRK